MHLSQCVCPTYVHAHTSMQELTELWDRAIALGLTNQNAVNMMHEHLRNGNFTAEKYAASWSARVEDAERASAAIAI